jgi:hypothetical protein
VAFLKVEVLLQPFRGSSKLSSSERKKDPSSGLFLQPDESLRLLLDSGTDVNSSLPGTSAFGTGGEKEARAK